MARDENGRFVKGSSGNPKGRPTKEREQKYYEYAMNTVTYKDWQAILNRAVADAKRGDQQARKWLSDYLAPQNQRIEHTGADGGPIETKVTDERYSQSISALADAIGKALSGPGNAPDGTLGSSK